jgi:hypothetical protein
MPINLNFTVDVLGIAQAIANGVSPDPNRGGFVKNLMETTFYAAGQRFNVMVFNLNQNYTDRFRGVVFYGSTTYNGITFGIWAFQSGEFTNHGDGGWINWAFRGWFNRNDKRVRFKNPFNAVPAALSYPDEELGEESNMVLGRVEFLEPVSQGEDI